MDRPVNALHVQGWFDLAKRITELGRDLKVRVVVLRAEGRGFNAGVDIKEMQATEGFSALIGANHGCFTAFKAVYECEVPVIAAVQGFCPAGVSAWSAMPTSSSPGRRHLWAPRGRPRRARGRHPPGRLVPQHKMRARYTATRACAQELHAWGSILSVVPREQLRDTAMRVAENIAAKRPNVIRAAKQSLNGIDPVDVNKSYRYEQGFTFELNLAGDGDAARDAFVETGKEAT